MIGMQGGSRRRRSGRSRQDSPVRRRSRRLLGPERLEERSLLNGSLDLGFGDDGRATFTFDEPFSGTGNYADDVAIQADGSALVLGRFRALTHGPFDVALARIGTDGVLDAAFGDRGIAPIVSDLPADLTEVAVQADGRIVLAGSIDGALGVIRLEPDGTLDVSFDGDGIATIAGHGRFDPAGVEIQADGRIVVAGSSNNRFVAARFNPDGTPDVDFGDQGVATVDFGIGMNERAEGMVIQPDGRIILAGTIGSTYDTDFAIARLNLDGSLDTGFGLDGRTTIGIRSRDELHAVALLPDGRIVLGGSAVNPGSGETRIVAALAALDPDGDLDPDFGEDGLRIFETIGSPYGSTLHVSDLAVTPDGQLLVAGNLPDPAISQGRYGITRLEADGTTDVGFGDNGHTVVDFGGSYSYGFALFERSALDVNDAGRIVLVGTISSYAFADFGVATLDSDGDWDNSFDGDGRLRLDFQRGDRYVAHDVVAQPDGKLIVVGSIPGLREPTAVVARINPDGTLDPTFSDDGWVSFLDGLKPSSVALLPDGKLLIVNGFSIGFGVRRLNADGSPDVRFGNSPSGLVFVDVATYDLFTSPKERVWLGGFAVQPDGPVVMTGTRTYFDPDTGAPRTELVAARINPDGSLDPSFGGDGTVKIDLDGETEVVTGLVLQPDGRIVLVGSAEAATALSGSARDFLAVRLEADGTLDESFGPGGKVSIAFDLGGSNDDRAEGVVLLPDGRIVLAGSVSSGSPESPRSLVALAVLGRDGQLDEGFDGDGRLTFSIDGRDDLGTIGDVAVGADGRIVLVLRSEALPTLASVFAVARINPDGTFDAGFDGDGRAIVSFGDGIGASAEVVALDPRGGIIVAGVAVDRSFSSLAVARLVGVAGSPEVTRLGPVDPEVRTAGIDLVEVIFSLPIDAASFSVDDLVLTRDGRVLPLDGVTIAAVPDRPMTFLVSGLGGLTAADGAYSLLVDAAGVVSIAGDAGSGTARVGFSVDATGPGVAAVGPVDPTPRREPVDSVEIRFNEPIEASSFTLADLVLTRDGQAVVPDGVTITPIDGEPGAFRVAGLGGLTGGEGSYVLAVDASGVRDLLGNPGIGAGSVRFEILPPLLVDGEVDSVGDGGHGRAELVSYAFDLASGVGTFRFRMADGTIRVESVSGLSATDIAVSGDFDGDGIADAAVVRPFARLGGGDGPDASVWIIIRSSDGQRREIAFGAAGTLDRPVPADYDGDGITDIATFRAASDLTPGAAEWFILPSSSGPAYRVAFGAAGGLDQPAVADYDGDGQADIATFRPVSDLIAGAAQWFVLPSSANDLRFSRRLGGFPLAFGASGEGNRPAPADYNGDGRADLAFFDAGPGAGAGAPRWFVLPSSGPTPGFSGGFPFSLGGVGHLPAVADHDGDGRPDIAVYDPSTRTLAAASTGLDGRPSGAISSEEIGGEAGTELVLPFASAGRGLGMAARRAVASVVDEAIAAIAGEA